MFESTWDPGNPTGEGGEGGREAREAVGPISGPAPCLQARSGAGTSSWRGLLLGFQSLTHAFPSHLDPVVWIPQIVCAEDRSQSWEPTTTGFSILFRKNGRGVEFPGLGTTRSSEGLPYFYLTLPAPTPAGRYLLELRGAQAGHEDETGFTGDCGY